MASRNPRSKPRSSAQKSAAAKPQSQNRRELWGIICILAALFGIICWFNTDAVVIKSCTKLLVGLFGQTGRYLLPVALIYTAVLLFRRRRHPILLRVICSFTMIFTLGCLYQLLFGTVDDYGKLYSGALSGGSAGLLPGALALLLKKGITLAGALIAFFVLLILQLLALMRMTVNSLITAIKNRPRPEREEPEERDAAEVLVNRVTQKHMEHKQRAESRRNTNEFDLPVDDPPALPEKKRGERKSRVISPDEFLQKKPLDEKQITLNEVELHEPMEAQKPVRVQEAEVAEPVQKPAAPVIELVPDEPPAVKKPEEPKLKRGEAAASAQEIAEEIREKEGADDAPEYVYPSISLLNQRRQGMVDGTTEMRENSKRLADTLESFGIEPHIVNVIRGPSVTRYELELDRGVKLSKITNLADDIALSLGATGVRISAIPDKISVVGIEVPNRIVNTVFAREVIDSPAFRNGKSKLSFAVGKDISGNCIVGDIAKLPHMLIAGTTGSGKSVCMNTIILSLLYKAKPTEVRLIMVDPKMVELGVYNGIPHLLIPVVTDPKKAAGALQWTVTEMMRRYRLMSEVGVRDLESYNKAIFSDPDQKPMEQVVVVIDELADLMLVAAKEVEESICRIAQMGRAAGIHLVIATQRPSADVITGLMKANIPSRIAFAVSSAMESRIILDTPGAEKLVGKGDMLFAPLGQGKPKRVQGCFITDDEVQAVVNSIKDKSESDYSAEIMEQIEKRAEQSGKTSADSSSGSQEASDGDELLPAAVEVILETGQASVSMLQRRLKLGYARAARIVDEMEERGIVGPFEGAKPRQLLITREQWEQMRNGTPPVEDEIP